MQNSRYLEEIFDFYHFYIISAIIASENWKIPVFVT